MQTRIKIYLSIVGDNFDPIILSEKIGVQPTSFWYKGDVIPQNQVLESDRIRYRIETDWEYGFDFVETFDLDELLMKLEPILKNSRHVLKKFITENNCDGIINIVIEMYNGHTPNVHFNKDFLELISYIGLEIDVDMYTFSED